MLQYEWQSCFCSAGYCPPRTVCLRFAGRREGDLKHALIAGVKVGDAVSDAVTAQLVRKERGAINQPLYTNIPTHF